MKATKICTYCKEKFTPKRKDAVFCSDTCRWNNWKEKKDSENVKPRPAKELLQVANKPALQNTLRGIVQNEEIEWDFVSEQKEELPKTGIKTILIETPLYKEKRARIQVLDTFVKRVSEEIKAIDYKISVLEQDTSLLPISSLIAGGLTGSKIGGNNNWAILFGAMAGWGAGKLTDNTLFKKTREEERKKNIALLQQARAENQTLVEQSQKEIFRLAAEILLIKRPGILQGSEPVTIPKLSLSGLILKGTAPKQLEIQKQNNILAKSTTINKESIVIQTDDKIISSRQLKEMDYKSLNFQGRWLDFFGQPAIVFHLVVHGKSGEGKSTFCIQLANYLAENFGNVVYISGEEGFSKTLRDKVISATGNSNCLFFADLSSYEEIKNRIEPDKFHFIFFDSLNTLQIDAIRLRELKELYSNSAFITISQSTKDGKVRGSNEIIHDSDIVMCVENGVATTTKNRFKERGKEFSVFPEEKQGGKESISNA